VREDSLGERCDGPHLELVVTQIEILQKSQSTRNQRPDGSNRNRSRLGIKGQRDLTLLHRCLVLLTLREIERAAGLTPLVIANTTRTLGRTRPQRPSHREHRGDCPKVDKKTSQHFQREAKPCGLRTFDSPFLEEITSHHFPKKFMISSFECYSEATEPINTFVNIRTRWRSTLTMTCS